MLFRVPEHSVPFALLREQENLGFHEVDLVAPPARCWSDGEPPPPVALVSVDREQTAQEPLPSSVLAAPPDGASPMAMSRASLARLHAWLLVCEDPQRRLEASAVQPLAHQASLVAHVLERPELLRVMIADEVGLGKTVEAGLIVKALLERDPNARVLYLAPARLVRNVHREFARLGLRFRQWVAGADANASLGEDDRVIASIHRAAHGDNRNRLEATKPWDVIIVDECHHLTDWQEGGGKPTRKYALVRDLVERQGSNARVILLSGTPHQGHQARFENLLKLLCRRGEGLDAVRGRVIYRIKDDIQDWDRRPLFPGRQVNPPIVIDLGPAHRAWLEHIHDLYEPRAGGRDARQRASGWRCSQALQWAASSVEAGLGYLVRQALRAEWGLERAGMSEATAALRPYRLGRPDEPLCDLFARMRREVARQQTDHDVDDIEDEEEEDRWTPDPTKLAELLREGVALLKTVGDEKWRGLDQSVLQGTDGEPVVLFAQPIETVTALARYLAATYGERPALILGGQSDDDRQREVDRFTRPGGPRFLVSSRAGGEGINLQTARRVVHVDVPWNPMEMEQRVGRVHRFGSRRTIVVDTLVVRDSRETDAFRVARSKLEDISRTLVPKERFESLFGRVMALIPAQDLQAVLSAAPLAPLSSDDQTRLAALVSAGFNQWQSFHERFGESQREFASIDPGAAAWSDLINFVRAHLSAEIVEGFTTLRFRLHEGEVVDASEEATVLRLRDDKFAKERLFAAGDVGGMPVLDAQGTRAEPLGTNVGPVTRALRKLGLEGGARGAAWLRLPADEGASVFDGEANGFLVMARCSLRAEGASRRMLSHRLHAWRVSSDGAPAVEVKGDALQSLLRGLLRCGPRMRAEAPAALVAALARQEPEKILQLRRPSASDRVARIHHAVFPLLAAVVTR